MDGGRSCGDRHVAGCSRMAWRRREYLKCYLYIQWNGPLARAPHRGWAAEAAPFCNDRRGSKSNVALTSVPYFWIALFGCASHLKQPILMRAVGAYFWRQEAMITFTPLSGAAQSSTTSPLAYLLQVDDVRILIDCGSPDWSPEPSPFEESTPEQQEQPPSWTEYVEALEKFVSNK